MKSKKLTQSRSCHSIKWKGNAVAAARQVTSHPNFDSKIALKKSGPSIKQPPMSKLMLRRRQKSSQPVKKLSLQLLQQKAVLRVASPLDGQDATCNC